MQVQHVGEARAIKPRDVVTAALSKNWLKLMRQDHSLALAITVELPILFEWWDSNCFLSLSHNATMCGFPHRPMLSIKMLSICLFGVFWITFLASALSCLNFSQCLVFLVFLTLLYNCCLFLRMRLKAGLIHSRCWRELICLDGMCSFMISHMHQKAQVID